MRGDVARATRQDVLALRSRAAGAALKRARLCAHRATSDPLHEMLIALDHDSYVRPHRHVGKTESLHVIEGLADLVIFDEEGAIVEVVPVGGYGTDRVFYYRLNAPLFHTLRVRSDALTVHETTNGPFDPADTEFAAWSPESEAVEACARYLQALDQTLAALDPE